MILVEEGVLQLGEPGVQVAAQRSHDRQGGDAAGRRGAAAGRLTVQVSAAPTTAGLPYGEC